MELVINSLELVSKQQYLTRFDNNLSRMSQRPLIMQRFKPLLATQCFVFNIRA